MESSRGGPLTTFIMMLPLIVVPAIAMLKPADGSGGILSDLLNAATGNQSANDATGASADAEGNGPGGTDVDSFEALFGDGAAVEAPAFQADGRSEAGSPADGPPGFGHSANGPAVDAAAFEAAELEAGGLSPEDLLNDFSVDEFDPGSRTAVAPVTIGSAPGTLDVKTQGLLATLQKMGVSRTLWFSPDGRSSGFVAFVDAGQGVLRYRFESVAATPVAAVSDVILQIEEWQRTAGR